MTDTLAAPLPAAAAGRPHRRPPLVLVALLPGAAVVALAVLAGAAAGVPRRDLFRDPAGYLETPLHVGTVSTLGVMVWAAAAALALAYADPRRPWLRAAGLLTAYVAVDDAFLLHERVLPALTGLPEEAILLGYAVAAAAVLRLAWPYARRDPAPEVLLLVAALLAASQALDVLGSVANPFRGTAEGARNVAEEGAKFAGAAAWLCYLALTRGGTGRPGQQRIECRFDSA